MDNNTKENGRTNLLNGSSEGDGSMHDDWT